MTELAKEIETIRRQHGSELLILGHQYQSQEVLAHADVIGDSLELARKAAASSAARIVFCGVHFMAESADILTRPTQSVYMPETGAGCPMADMADAHVVEKAWSFLQRNGGGWIPVVYVNSTATVKAFCGRNGGSACTSSNAPRVFRWALDQGKRIFFLPDIHLGVNSAHDLGIPDEETAIYDYRRPDGGLTPEALARARVLVWGGFCPIHVAFTVADILAVRSNWPEARIIVHPEAPKEVVRLSDAHGSTSQIIAYVRDAAPGTTIVIGTESQLVKRLAAEYKDRLTIRMLKGSFCPNMAKTNTSNLLRILRDWPDRNRVSVPAHLAADARLCLEKMLSL